MSNFDSVIKLSDIEFRWSKQSHATLKIAELNIKQGEHLFIQGASGSGKSTLLNIISGVLSPEQGKVELLGQNIQKLTAAQKDRFRADHLGIVFQQFNLLPYLSAKENIELAIEVSATRKQKAKASNKLSSIHLLTNLGLNAELADKKASELSIGQQQRVAVARALIGEPEILIVDEPTSALDSDNRDRFMQQLFAVAEQANSTIIFVSHDAALKSYFCKSCQLDDINQVTKQTNTLTDLAEAI